MFRKKGFTLLELIIVVIVIGVLATIAIPQYMKAVERAKVAKAKSNVALIMQAEKMHRAKNDTYLVVDSTTSLNDALGDFVELKAVDNDPDWTYDARVANYTDETEGIWAVAQRSAGPYIGAVVALNSDGGWDTAEGVHPLH